MEIMRVALYGRVSSEEQKQGENIASQLVEIQKFAKEKGWEVVKTFKDEGWSGSVLNRPGLDELRDAARQHEFDVALFNDLDRLGRTILVSIVIKDLEKNGVKVIFAKIPRQEDSPSYNLMLNTLSAFSQFEREMISDRVRRGKKYTAEYRKQIMTGIAPYGLRYLPKNPETKEPGRFAINEEEAPIVRKMFDWALSGISERGVARKLLAEKMMARSGKRFSRSTVHKILTNETYCGMWHYNKHIGSEPKRHFVLNKYPKRANYSNVLRPKKDWIAVPVPINIITKEEFELVQLKLKKNLTFSLRNSKNFYLLSGLIKCGACGEPFYSDSYHGKPVYRCSNKKKRFPLPADCPERRSISARILEPYVWDKLMDTLRKPDFIDDLRNGYRNKYSWKQTEWRSSLEKSLGNLEIEETRLTTTYAKGYISENELVKQKERIKKERLGIEEQLKDLNASGGDKEEAKLLKAGLLTWTRKFIVDSFNMPPEEKREKLRQFVKEIIIAKTGVKIRGFFPGKIISGELESDSRCMHTEDFCKVRREQEKLCWPEPYQEFFLL